MRGFRVILRTLGQRNYGLYAAGNSVSLVGTWMQKIAVGWLAWELTHSYTWIGIVAFLDLAPSVLIGPIGGAVADRIDHMRIILWSQVTAMIVSFGMWGAAALGLMTIWPLAAFVLVNGVVLAFTQPARLAIVSSLVPRDDVQTAVAINAIIFNTARFVGPAVAGIVIARWGVAAAFLVKSLTYLAFLLALLRIKLAPEPQHPRAADSSILGDIGASLGYVGRHAGIGPVLLLQTMLSFSVRAVIELLPGFAGAVFARGVDGLAWLTSTIGIGAIVGGVWLAQRGRTEGMTAIVLLASAGGALATLGFVAGTAFWPALVAIGISGVAMVISGVGAQTQVQMAVAPQMRARVLSLYGTIIRGGPALGALVIGGVADYVGLRLPTAIAALLILGACAWSWTQRRAIAEGLGDR
jgi:predicted MFS family arabinose efflux permease